MSITPSTPTNLGDQLKSFWSRPEGKTGMIFVALAAAAAAKTMNIIPVLPSGRDQKDFNSSPRFVGVEGVMLMVFSFHPWRRLTYLAFS